MRIIIGESNFHNLVNVENKVVQQKETGITFVAESVEEGDEIMKVVNKFLDIEKAD